MKLEDGSTDRVIVAWMRVFIALAQLVLVVWAVVHFGWLVLVPIVGASVRLE
jgi:hypothetical protein